MKRTLIIAGVCLCFLAVFVVACNTLYYVPTPDTAKGMRRLREIAGTARPLINALEKYRHDHGGYPTTVKALFPAYLSSQTTSRDWGYGVEPTMGKPQKYSLAECWRDPCLKYQHSPKASHWFYDPGTGEASTPLPF